MLGGIDDTLCVRQKLVPSLQDLRIEQNVPEVPHNFFIHTLDDVVGVGSQIGRRYQSGIHQGYHKSSCIS